MTLFVRMSQIVSGLHFARNYNSWSEQRNIFLFSEIDM
jgi:hypothetical protein